jgi:thiosulfate dehydrogenase
MGRAALILVLIVLTGCRKEPDTPGASTQLSVVPLADSAFPNTPMGRAARRGRAILAATRDSLPEYVGNGLRCTSCHLDDGRRPHAMPWLGVHARYPQYRSRAARVLTVEDRINECLQRSLGGRPLPPADERLRAIEAYFAFISAGVPTGTRTPGQGIDSVDAVRPDTSAGEIVFAQTCARCHGSDGQGTALATPIWGERAYTIAAGMARYRMAAGFIHRNMPYDAPGTLTEQQALDVAAYIDSRPRRDHAGKELDWPNGGAPPDIPYRTTATNASKSPAK